MQLIKRESYLQILRSMKDTNLIKVLTGIRRSGKSTILKLFQAELISSGISKEQIHSYSFENPDLSTKSWKDIYDLITSKLSSKKMNYIFLDEVQLVDSFERLLVGLQSLENVDLYVTGSNAYLLSSELATLLSGRSFEISVYPFSFAEYVAARNSMDNPTKSNEELFNDYLLYGGFPQALETYERDPALVDQYLVGILETVIGRDIMDRGKISSRPVLDKINKYLMQNIGNPVAAQKIQNVFAGDNIAPSHHTVSNYMNALESSYLFYNAQRLHIQGKEILKTQGKYYLVDTGLRNALLGREANVDMGHLLENVVYFELKRRNKNVWIGKTNSSEIDFVVQDQAGYSSYYQVAWTTNSSPETLNRELESLRSVKDYSSRFLLTMDYDEPTYDGIRKINILKWLLDTE